MIVVRSVLPESGCRYLTLWHMELEKFGRQLRLLLLLTQNHALTVDEICQHVGLSRRTFYRYVDSFKQLGFLVHRNGAYWSISLDSPFFVKINTAYRFSEAEALTILRVLSSVYDPSADVQAVREKLDHLYNPETLRRAGEDELMADKIGTIHRAISEERLLLIHDYDSPTSQTRSDRIVEPYLFMNHGAEVRCYELSTHTNKTFKLARMGSVEILDLLWAHKGDHAPCRRDLFGFIGEETVPVTLILGRLATHLLLEEHPEARFELTLVPGREGHSRLQTRVSGMAGIGRFILGLYDDIEIVDSPALTAYVDKRIREMSEHLAKREANPDPGFVKVAVEDEEE